MSVDVIIPMFNGRAFIAETLGAVFRQTLKPERVVVVDDGSIDGSPAIAAGFRNVTLLRNPRKGSAAARNWGMRHSSSEFVAFLDYDDLWHPRHLEILRGILEANPGFPLAAGALKSFPHGSRPRFNAGLRSCDCFDPWMVYPTHDVGCTPSATLFRRKAVLGAGGWRQEHDPIADYSIWMQLSIDRPVLRSQAVTVGYRRHASSISSTYYRNDPRRYLSAALRTDDHLLAAFLSSPARSAGEKECMKRRNRAAHHLVEIIRGLVGGKSRALMKAARRLEEVIADEDIFFRYSLFRNFMYMHQPFYDENESALVRRDLIRLLEALPADAAVTRRVVSEIIVWSRPGLGFFMRYFGRGPWQMRRLSLLARAVKKRFLKSSFLSAPVSARQTDPGE